jgi:pilus assembly protein Flp/PilA
MLDNAMLALWARLADVRREDGQGLVEYALILVLVSIASVLLLTALGTDIGAVFSDISAELS